MVWSLGKVHDQVKGKESVEQVTREYKRIGMEAAKGGECVCGTKNAFFLCVIAAREKKARQARVVRRSGRERGVSLSLRGQGKK